MGYLGTAPPIILYIPLLFYPNAFYSIGMGIKFGGGQYIYVGGKLFYCPGNCFIGGEVGLSVGYQSSCPTNQVVDRVKK